ncbi:site-specific DNA-methyltransferase [Segatella sinensis]|uniref:site-specific DNA-methyltransferase (adenine-specific) n=1 Tax=Segatella sinensis TaxID=3085167 RepID=A0ABV1FXS3_9BACT
MDRPNRMELQSADGAQLNLDALYQIAPSCFTEVADADTGGVKRVVNFDVLRQLLGDNAVEDAPEAYEFNWVGKQAARAEVLKPIKKTLRPVKEDSVDWDNTQNLYIEGDNLEVLKLLQKSYLGKVKMIYIDPPYNTGKDFIYHDDFAMSVDEYAEASDSVDELGNKYIKNMDSNGRFHSDWCSMIYSRLMVARTLLSEDGVIFISIGEKESANLAKIADEIFGTSNRLAFFCWRTDGNFDNQARIKNCHEYIYLYAKNETQILLPKAIDPNIPKDSKIFKQEIRNTIIKNGPKNPVCDVVIPIGFPCEIENFVIKKDSVVWPKYSDDVIIENFKTTNKVVASTGWASRAQLVEFIENDYNPVVDTKGQSTVFVLTKTGAIETIKKRGEVSHVISFLNGMGGTQKATADMGELGNYFDYPKPVVLMKYLSKMYSEKDDIVLDFFSGSATTAHAVMQLNAEDGGNRKFIMVQIPEETPEDSEARKAGYNTIPEIARERIRRAGKKIKEESPLTTADLDTGFRVFRLDEGNYEDVKRSPKEFKQDQLDLFLNNIKTDRNDLDLLFGCMLDWGVQLSLPMTQEVVDGKTIYTVNDGDLVACFAENVSEDVVKAMAEKMPLRVIFRDSCFAQDADKINIYETFKQKLDWSDQEVVKNIRVI